MTLAEALERPDIFAPFFVGPSWAALKVIVKLIDGVELTSDEMALAFTLTGRKVFSRRGYRRIVVIAGRRSAKTRLMALRALWKATSIIYDKRLAPGEMATVACIAADRKQARSLMRYVTGLARAVPSIAAMITNETADSIEFGNRTLIEIHTASFRVTRGYSLAGAYGDEVAFWTGIDGGANPAEEIVAALLPGLATLGGELMIGSTPYSKSGLLYSLFTSHWGQDDSEVLVIKATSLVMNPTLDRVLVDEALAADPAKAKAEYLAEFRDDIAGYIDREIVEASVDKGVIIRPRVPGVRYTAACDPSGGAHDSFTAAVSHLEGNIAVLDLLFERKAPFSPAEVVRDIAEIIKGYGVGLIVGDRYAGNWPSEQFSNHSITYQHSHRDRSAIYVDALPLLMGGRIRLLDNKRLVGQIAGLERRSLPGGKDKVDHGIGNFDDAANSALLALTLSAQFQFQPKLFAGAVELLLASEQKPGTRSDALGGYSGPGKYFADYVG